MLFFIDESWQEVDGVPVGALGAVAIPLASYNAYCRQFFYIKKKTLGATQLNESEVKGQHAFARASFKRQELRGDSHWLATVDAIFDCLTRFGARTFLVWTSNAEHASLRNPAAILSKPYRQLLFDMRAFMRNEASGRLGALNFDQRGLKEDAAVGTAVANFLVRTNAGWDRHFVQIPNFTVSAVSPGLQAADLVAHLGPHFANPDTRPEMIPYLERAKALRYEYPQGRRRRKCIRRII